MSRVPAIARSGGDARWKPTVVVLGLVAGLGAVLSIGGSIALGAEGLGAAWWDQGGALFMLMGAATAVFVWLVAPGQSGNAVVWIMTATAFASGVFLAGWATAAGVAVDPGLLRNVTQVGDPSRLTEAVLRILEVAVPAWVPAVFLPLTLGLLLFPDGRLPSPRWRWVGVLAVGAMVVGMPAWAWNFRPAATSPTDTGLVFGAAMSACTLAVVLCLAALFVRFRRSRRVTRQQFKWVVWGAAVFVPTVLATFAASGSRYELLATSVMVVGGGLLVAAYGIAVGRYHLYDIDVVINRSLVFLVLATFITGVYVVVAVGVGAAVGGSSLWLATLATAVVAVAFEPVRVRGQRWANRIVYGKRATPYEVLSEVTGRLALAEDEEGLFDRMASMLAAGTGAVHAGVWLADDDGFRCVAATTTRPPMPLATQDDLPGHVEVIEHADETLGALTVEKARGDPLTATEERLVTDLAGSAALVFRRLRLDAALRAKAVELERSRRRLVHAQDEERRHIESQLRDGAQQQVVGLKVKLEVARSLARQEHLDRVYELVGQIRDDAQRALGQIGSLARGIYPPLLVEEGLTAALPALAAASPLDVRVVTDLERRLPVEVEGAVYFCVAEALTNASKHAHDPIHVRVTHADGTLTFQVEDSGPGFDPDQAVQGSGLRNMTDRLDTLGGRLTVTSVPGKATTVAGAVAVAQPARR